MKKRLSDTYEPGALVEITFGGDKWLPAFVRKLDHPGIWVQDREGRQWFVTNTRRIRERRYAG